MWREVTISKAKIDEEALLRGRAKRTDMGAAVYFVGIVRGEEAGEAIAGLEYEAFERMARHQFEILLDKVERQWPVESIRLTHRVGLVLAGEASLWVEALAGHRGEALAAVEFIVDEMKRVVPIWKKPVKG